MREYRDTTPSWAFGWTRIAGLLAGLGIVLTAGCAAVPRMPVQARQYHLDVHVDPATHRLCGQAAIDIDRAGAEAVEPGKPCAVEFRLHEDLKVQEVWAGGAQVKRFYRCRADEEEAPPGHEGGPITTARYVVVLDRPTDALTLFVKYEGELWQDVEAGEKPGAIHNFMMRAHIGEEGVYLAGGPWYPEPVAPKDAPPRPADFRLLTNSIDGFVLQAGAVRDEERSQETGQLAWRSPYPLDGLVLVGGPHEVHEAEHNGRRITVQLKPEQAQFAPSLIATIQRLWDRYEPLIGPYPADEYAVVDNFFSSGFAFPTFTLLSSAVIEMGPRAQMRHGMYDHELLHCWWGNGVLVDPRDGNWCESITSYATNYYGYVLDGNEEDARRKRRNYSHFLSRMKPERDKPLGEFGHVKNFPRSIAYDKGAMIFHMLAGKIGQEELWETMRRFNAQYLGHYANWADIQRLAEEVGGLDLETFFTQWVRQAGAPELSLTDPVYDASADTLSFMLSQGDNSFELDVPVRIEHAEGALDVTVPLTRAKQSITLKVEAEPTFVSADPDFQLFRKVPLGEIVPTTNSTHYCDQLATALPPGTCPEEYDGVVDVFTERRDPEDCVELRAGAVDVEVLMDRCVLVLGDAVHDPTVRAFLSGINFPVTFGERGFVFDGQAFVDAGDAVMCTVRHPTIEGGGVTVIYGNSLKAVPRPWVLPFYDRSLIVFKNGMAVQRADFEKDMRVKVAKRQ